MKKSFAILLVTVLTSCVTALEPPKSNTDYKNIIGKTIIIGNLKVAQYDFPEAMNWDDATLACAKLGKGWRLPTKNELNSLYLSKDKIGGFAYNYYWSSTDEDDGIIAWKQSFVDGRQNFGSNEGNEANVRAMKSF